MNEDLLKRLIATIKCGHCGQHYREDHIEIVEHDEEIWFLQVFCESCQVKAMVAAVIQQEKETAGTDYQETKVSRLEFLDVVGGDDVLDMRRFLEDFDGDFAGLFREEIKPE